MRYLPLWRAAASTIPIAWIAESPSVLHTKGVCIDIVHDLGDAFTSNGTWVISLPGKELC